LGGVSGFAPQERAKKAIPESRRLRLLSGIPLETILHPFLSIQENAELLAKTANFIRQPSASIQLFTS
jgi:hypothetical protein